MSFRERERKKPPNTEEMLINRNKTKNTNMFRLPVKSSPFHGRDYNFLRPSLCLDRNR